MDSKELRVDNGAFRCMSPYIEDFIDLSEKVYPWHRCSSEK